MGWALSSILLLQALGLREACKNHNQTTRKFTVLTCSLTSRLLEAGEYKPALRLARESLGPLAAEHRELLPTLKATLLALAKPGPYLPKMMPTTAALATSLQVSQDPISGQRC